MLPTNVLREKAVDAVHANQPDLTLDQLRAEADKKVQEFVAWTSPPPPPVPAPPPPAGGAK